MIIDLKKSRSHKSKHFKESWNKITAKVIQLNYACLGRSDTNYEAMC